MNVTKEILKTDSIACPAEKITVTYQQIRDIISEHFEEIESLDEMTVAQVDAVSNFILENHDPVDMVVQETALEIEHHQEDIQVIEGRGSLVPKQSSELSQASPNQIQQLAPQEAIEIIQEIAADDTSRNKELAGQLLNQIDEKTNTMVALIEAMPEIEAEMLKRKLEKMSRKQVNYEEILNSHFRNSQNLTTHIKDLVAEYGVSF